MNRIFIDMDGVIVDFDAQVRETGLTGEQLKVINGAYLAMKPIDGAIEAVRSLIGMGFDVWIATKPPTGVAYAYSDKAQWVFNHIPELKRKIIITHHKGLLGDAGDFLLDDRPHKASCEEFAGTLLKFIDGYHWPQALDYFRCLQKNLKDKKGIHMETSIVEDTLTDGSKSYAVAFIDGSQTVKIDCLDESSATQLQAALEQHASFATIF